jgi:hypothetical protein
MDNLVSCNASDGIGHFPNLNSGCRSKKGNDNIEQVHQPFPRTGRLAENLNLSLDELLLKTGGNQATVYSYIIASVTNHEGNFVQKGSAPNFQGDLITLCNCKHRMRTFYDIPEWKDKWIAGFTGAKAGNGSNVLVYLMKVGIAFESYCDLWFSEDLPEAAKQAKSANKNKFGDVFQPKSKLTDKRDKFDFGHYVLPVGNHVHANPQNPDGWHKDINYEKGVCGRKAALLTGDEQYSFLWDKPKLFRSRQLHRGQTKDNLQSLLTGDLIQR